MEFARVLLDCGASPWALFLLVAQREKLLSRLQPDLQMEIRQELMKRFSLKTDL